MARAVERAHCGERPDALEGLALHNWGDLLFKTRVTTPEPKKETGSRRRSLLERARHRRSARAALHELRTAVPFPRTNRRGRCRIYERALEHQRALRDDARGDSDPERDGHRKLHPRPRSRKRDSRYEAGAGAGRSVGTGIRKARFAQRTARHLLHRTGRCARRHGPARTLLCSDETATGNRIRADCSALSRGWPSLAGMPMLRPLLTRPSD